VFRRQKGQPTDGHYICFAALTSFNAAKKKEKKKDCIFNKFQLDVTNNFQYPKKLRTLVFHFILVEDW
jgi:hypothetical protein